MQTLEEIVKGKEYPIIEYRYLIPLEAPELYDTLFGYCAYLNGKLESLDGDNYYLDAEITKWEEWKDEDEKLVLTVWETLQETDLVRG